MVTYHVKNRNAQLNKLTTIIIVGLIRAYEFSTTPTFKTAKVCDVYVVEVKLYAF